MKYTIDLSPEQDQLVKCLLRTGILGDQPTEVVKHLVTNQLQNFVTSGFVSKAVETHNLLKGAKL